MCDDGYIDNYVCDCESMDGQLCVCLRVMDSQLCVIVGLWTVNDVPP